MNKKRIRILLLLAVVAILAGYFITRAVVDKNRGVVLYGNVDIREVDLGFRVPGRVAEVLKDEGDEVHAGDVIARLDAEPYQRHVEEARAQAAALKARADMLTKGYRQEEIDQVKATVSERESALSNSKNLYVRQKNLLERRAISQQDFDDATERLNESQARLDSAKHNLVQMNAGYRPEEVAQAMGDLQKAQAALASSTLELKDTDMLAPSDGVIITRSLEPGAIVAAGTPVLTLSLNKPLWVRAYVHEPQLGLVKPGMKVEVYTDTEPGKAHSGKIGYVSPRAEFTPKSVETPELRTMLVYRIRVIMDDADIGLRQGMPVTVKIPHP